MTDMVLRSMSDLQVEHCDDEYTAPKKTTTWKEFKALSFLEKAEELGLTDEDEGSNCCGADIVMSDICSDCKEHCISGTEEEIEREEKIRSDHEDDMMAMDAEQELNRDYL